MFATKLTAVFATLAAAATAVSAAPTSFSTTTFTGGKVDLVFRPHITAPTAGQVWPVGSTQTVTWDTSNIPEENKNQTGLILLGYIEEGEINEHLDVANPLAFNFPITKGEAQVTVPEVADRDDYVVVLFGDSGNASPKFTIKKVDGSIPSISASLSTLAAPAAPSVTASFPSIADPSAPVSSVAQAAPASASVTASVSSVPVPSVSPSASASVSVSA